MWFFKTSETTRMVNNAGRGGASVPIFFRPTRSVSTAPHSLAPYYLCVSPPPSVAKQRAMTTGEVQNEQRTLEGVICMLVSLSNNLLTAV